MLDTFLRRAAEDLPVYITDVRDAFQACGTRPFHLHVNLYDGTIRRFALRLPETATQAEADFVFSYVYATIYNILSSLGALRLDVYLSPADAALMSLAQNLDIVFQTAQAKSQRTGYGKCLNVNERTLAALTGGQSKFGFRILDIGQEPAVPDAVAQTDYRPVFQTLPAMTSGRMVLGMDIGGTDIKLAVSIDGKLTLCKEFDWFPAAFTQAHQLIDPILLLTRLLRAAASLFAAGKAALLDKTILSKDASMDAIAHSIAAMEKAVGPTLRNFDAIGLSFPDVVIRNRIVGGETYKTRGMRENPELDYETEFAKITRLTDALTAYVKPDGVIMNTNDGPMAAFTAAVEQAAAGGDVSRGFFAHTLGTELGTGWVRPDGSIPEIPLEVYNFIIDLGSFTQKQYPSGDVRSINNFNTQLPGTLQKYASQSGVFRLAAKYLPSEDPSVYQQALDLGLLQWQGRSLVVPTEPKDMRKPCLEFFIAKAAEPGREACAEIFRQIGEYLAVTWRETDYILQPEAKDRTLFGRLVKNPVCFQLICQGAARREPALEQFAADGSLANTALMQRLEAHPDYTVAQFAQAVGAIYYGCLGLWQNKNPYLSMQSKIAHESREP
ncbi:MAG TPA: hypothetical protein DD738_12440 [Ruminiclostridium sp.]|nr:hypothetical protein [Ruminiclostridium sp.]